MVSFTREHLIFVARVFFVIWLAYFATLLVVVDVTCSIHGEHGVYMTYYYVLHALIVLTGVVVVWKFRNFCVQLLGIGYLIFVGYTCARMLVDEIWALQPGAFVFHVILYAGLVISLFLFLGEVVSTARAGEFPARLKAAARRCDPRTNQQALAIGVTGVVLLGILPFAYAGFFQEVSFVDDPANDMKVSFYHLPTGHLNYSWYVAPFSRAQADAELTRYQQLNSTFYYGCRQARFTNPQYRSNMTAVVRHLGDWGIDVVPVVAPQVEVPPGSGRYRGDFSTYYNYQWDLTTIDYLMDWIAEENLDNVRGLSLDVEGPKFADERNEVINRSLWAEAVAALQAKFDEFQARFPGRITHLIAMGGIAVDFFDGDDDLDIAQMTASVPPTWTTYGHMFYEIDDRYTGYSWYMNVRHVIEEVGVEQTVPWIGWFNEPDTLEQHPSYWANAKEQVKIGKALGVPELVLAPVRNVRGPDPTVALQRLDELVQIRQGFSPFGVRVVHDTRLYRDFPLWFEKFTPWYFIGDGSVFKDLLLGTPGAWFFWLAGVVTAATTTTFAIALWKAEKERHHARAPAPPPE